MASAPKEAAEPGNNGHATQGRALAFADPEPWPEPVDGGALLDELAATIRRYVVLPAVAADAAALWVLHTWAFDAAEVSPTLLFASPTMRCGKTRMLTVLTALVRRPLKTESATPAAIFRTVEKHRPTLLLDEFDATREENEELRSLLNSAFEVGGSILRSEGEGHDVKAFSTWAPRAVALIGNTWPTLEDRSIIVTIHRRRKDEEVVRLRRKQIAAEAEPLRRSAGRWVRDNMAALLAATDTAPDWLDDRAADSWEPLFTVASVAGGGWMARATQAAAALSSAADVDMEVAGVLLLGDLRVMLGCAKVDRLMTTEILTILHSSDDRPWASWGRSRKPITADAIRRLLRPYGVRPRNSGGYRGYYRLDLEDAWGRYLTPPQPSTPPFPVERGRQAHISLSSASAPDPKPDPEKTQGARPPDSEMCACLPQTPTPGQVEVSGVVEVVEGIAPAEPQNVNQQGGESSKIANDAESVLARCPGCGATSYLYGLPAKEGGLGYLACSRCDPAAAKAALEPGAPLGPDTPPCPDAGAQTAQDALIGANGARGWFTLDLPTVAGADGAEWGPFCSGDPVPAGFPETNVAALRARGAVTAVEPPSLTWTCPEDDGGLAWHPGRGAWVCRCCGRLTE